MSCPNCGYDYIVKSICSNCGMDVVLFVKTNRSSNDLYNKALRQAQENNLSSAKDNLIKSLEFNKSNEEARNLLGLILFEMGHIGEALKQWIISASISKNTENKAKVYIELIQTKSVQLEAYSESIKMYNQALAYVRQKSDDMAVIQLRKALEYNPKFIDAMNLLVFSYLLQKNKEKARFIVDKVLTIDSHNTVALNYYKEIVGSAFKPEQSKKNVQTSKHTSIEQKTSYAGLRQSEKKGFVETFRISEILCFMIGGLCGCALLYILIMPAIMEENEKELVSVQTQLSGTEQKLAEMQQEHIEKQQALESEVEELKNLSESLDAQVQEFSKIQKVQQTLDLYTTGSVVESADILVAMDLNGLPADVLEKVTRNKPTILNDAAQILYNQAVREYNAKDYSVSQANFEKFRKYAAENDKRIDDSIYYLGLIAEANGNKEAAKQYYRQVLDEHSSSNQYYNARNRFNALNR